MARGQPQKVQIVPNRPQQKKRQNQHVFYGINETLVFDPTNKGVMGVSTNGSGAGNIGAPLAPLGLTAATLSSGNFVAGGVGNVEPPHLLWLLSQASNFNQYRVIRATLVLTGNLGSTTSGVVNVFTTKDVSDLTSQGIQTAFIAGNARSYDLASLSQKSVRHNMTVDSTWKKVSSLLTIPGNSVPFDGTIATSVPVNSVNDLCFTAFQVQVVGGPNGASSVLTVQIEYDVEFKDPINLAINV